MAEIYSLCHICGKVAEHTCRLCGRPACDRHYDAGTGTCSAHAGKKEVRQRMKS